MLHQRITGQPIEEHWFDGTDDGKASHAEKVELSPKPIRRGDYFGPRSFGFEPLPALAHLDDGACREPRRYLVVFPPSEPQA